MMMFHLQLEIIKRPSLQIYKYIQCTQQVMPFTYTSQHSKVRKYKKNQHEELIAKKSPNYRNTEQIRTEHWSTGVL